MWLLKNRSIAWAVLAIVILLSLSVSGGGALRDDRNATADIFVMGVNGDGLSIENDLRARATAAKGFGEAARGYNVDAEAISALDAAADDLIASKSVGEKFRANEALTGAFRALDEIVKGMNLSKDEASEFTRNAAEFHSRADTIRRDVYNEKAAQFNESLKSFPASFIAWISGVGSLELFQ